MSIEQRRISDFLQCELYHSLGAYRVATQRLAALQERLASTDATSGDESRPRADRASLRDHRRPLSTGPFGRVVEHTQVYNALLHKRRHATGWSSWAEAEQLIRHPLPKRLPLSKGDRFALPMADPDHGPGKLWIRPEACAWIHDFYAAAENVLKRGWEKKEPPRGTLAREPYSFRQSLITWRNGATSPLGGLELAQLRGHRYRHRLEDARNDLAGAMPPDGADPQITDEQADRIVSRIAEDNLDTGAGSLSMFVLEALVEAHLGMHAVEACQSAALGPHAELPGALKEGAWLDEELDRCIALDTFVYCAGRTAPWLFAEDLQEGRQVFDDVSLAWQNVKPTRCIWIATQLSLLALHRRAYARLLKPGRAHKVEAYNDFHKLQGLIRDAERRVQLAPIHVEGAFEFLAGLDAQAHYHTGELYRKEHAQRPARKHFQAAVHRLDQLRDAENTAEAMQDVLIDSRWKVDLQIAHGKASYELGRHKESLCWHLRGWRAFLELLAADTETEASTGEISRAIAWLENVRYEPELRKVEVEENLAPVVEQLKRIAVNRRLGGLAADILLRLGHLLFTLNISRKGVQEGRGDPGARIERTLGFPCLRKALECDEHSTLVGADVLKVRARVREWSLAGNLRGQAGELPKAYDAVLERPALAAVGEQWPGGGDDYEGLARVAEYLMLQAHARVDKQHEFDSDEDREDYQAARRLLLDFFMHTDSINVRKSQVHRFLMRPAAEGAPPCAKGEPAIEFVCMRRYSSAFPLLPRPSAFRALGGGYFVRLHAVENGEREKPYGIVVDPGVDYVENLYRAGFSLSDVRMVIVTHDHVDHLGSLEPLLSLLHTRSEIYKDQSDTPREPEVHVLASESVLARYAHVDQLRPQKRFHPLGKFSNGGSRLLERLGFPEGFGLKALSSKPIDGKGHKDLSGKPAYGLCFSGPRGISLAITGDTPTPPGRDDVDGRERWLSAWKSALEADVLVAHLSSVPLTELRKLARLDVGGGTLRKEDVLRLREIAARLKGSIERVLKDGAGEPLDAETRALLRRLVANANKLIRVGVGVAANELQVLRDEVEHDAEALRAKLAEDKQRYRTLTQVTLEALELATDLRCTPTDPLELERIRWRLERPGVPNLRARLEFAMWLRSGQHGPTADLVGRVPEQWESPQPHAFLQGVLRWAREYRRVRSDDRPGLFVLGELSEELGSMRGKVATRLNETVLGLPQWEGGDKPRFYALTSDIGLQLFVMPPGDGKDAGAPMARREALLAPKAPMGDLPHSNDVKVLCTNCSLDTDRATEERYHPMHMLFEVCVKGENEGIFYNCKEHDPSNQEKEVFLEQLERFDIFGH